MFDFISYVRDSGLEIRLLPPGEGVLIRLEVKVPNSETCEQYSIIDRDAALCGNIDIYTGRVLDAMAARIGSRKAQEYANRHNSNQMRDREDFFREA